MTLMCMVSPQHTYCQNQAILDESQNVQCISKLVQAWRVGSDITSKRVLTYLLVVKTLQTIWK